ncbi:MAG TPA: ATP-binding protein [Acidimicrobiia bacterium]|nr:ATP-binding protein [Acidimicrobiia bacterium]
MDTTSIVLVLVAGAAVATATWLFARNRRHARSVSDAISRIGAPATGGRHRVADLDAALDRLERSTAAAQRERARLAGAVHAAPLGIVITDDEGLVVTANPAAARYLGARRGEAVAEVRIREAIEGAILGRSAVESEVELYTPVRTILQVAAIPLDFGVASAGCVAFVADVSEERRVEAMRRDFIANVGHELKTPLGALAVLAETLASGIEGDPASTRLAERLQTESNRLARLVGDILDLSQAEALAAHDEPVSVADPIEGAVRDVAEVAESREIALEVDPIDPALRVAGDARQLRTMVSNLIENAVKYSFKKNDAAPKVSVAAAAEGDSIVIQVVDRGIGIPEAHIDRIFERFYRVDRARSRDTGGTGLGLSIARHIARNHRGDVTVESVEGEGSTFRVTLPRWKAPARGS